MFSASATAHSQILTKFSAHKLKKIEEKLRKRLKEIKKAKFRLLNKLTAHFFFVLQRTPKHYFANTKRVKLNSTAHTSETSTPNNHYSFATLFHFKLLMVHHNS